jgi:TusA-related sulfurtransferase
MSEAALKLVELTVEAFKNCREKPQYKFLVEVSEAKPGDRLEIVGEDAILSFDTVVGILEDEGFEYEILERDDLIGTYRLIAWKK